MAGVHADRLVVVANATADPDGADRLARALLPAFGEGPVVVGPPAADIGAAAAATRTALSALRAAPAWPTAPRPVHADALLPERALAGDADARAELIEDVYEPLVAAGGALVDTVTAFLDSGGALEATARSLFVHANTVRYRLRRVAELCGQTPTEARGALTIRIALTLGRLETLT
jgi:DNA-binding PucR family transcriptional regulator